MQKAFGTALAPLPSGKKGTARVALVDLKESSRYLLAECFRQFGIETVLVSTGAAERLSQEKFEACVVNLAPGAASVMEAARTSASNSRIVLYGLGGSAPEAMRYSKYGINAMFQEPLERPAALKLVRATHMLVLHEFRRYARIPIITEVLVVSNDGHRLSTSSNRSQLRWPVAEELRRHACRNQCGNIFLAADPSARERPRCSDLAESQVLRIALRSRRRTPA